MATIFTTMELLLMAIEGQMKSKKLVPCQLQYLNNYCYVLVVCLSSLLTIICAFYILHIWQWTLILNVELCDVCTFS